MLSHDVDCPVCRDVYGGKATQPSPMGGWYGYHCDVCGFVGLTDLAVVALEDIPARTSRMRFAALAHILATADRSGSNRHFMLKEDDLTSRLQKLSSPTPPIQMLNFLRIIGDHMNETGEPYVHEFPTIARVGAPTGEAFEVLKNEMAARGLIKFTAELPRQTASRGEVYFPEYSLTLDGWEKYEAEKKGQLSGKYGFLAMAFKKKDLDDFLAAVKPKIVAATGYQLKDVTEFSRAGLIDNIIRDQIRDAAFVIADLSHANHGAYWEAGVCRRAREAGDLHV